MAAPETGSDIRIVNDGKLTNWNSQKSYIERPLSHSALIAAHPDTTIVLAGPPRLISGDTTVENNIFPIGMVQAVALTQRIPTTPMQAIGSGRLFYVSGKAQVGVTLQRLALKGKNLLKVLYSNALNLGVDPSNLDDIAALKKDSDTLINLDSELFRIPFGLGMLYKDRLHHTISSYYLEMCAISDWSMQVAVGQNMILESVSIMCDRIYPYVFGSTPNDTHPETDNIYKAVFGEKGSTNKDYDTSNP